MRKQKKYSGVIVPMITPLTENGKIDEASVEKIIENFIAADVQPLLFGTTGETASLSQIDKNEYAEMVTEKFSGRTAVYAAVSDNSFDDAINAAKKYLDMGIEGLVVLLPGYYPITTDQMMNYYENFAENIDGEMFIYNIPATTHLSIPLEVIDRLSYHDKIVGIKDSERDYDRLLKSIELWKARTDFSHFIGWGAQCFNGMWLGSDGIVPSTGNFDAKIYREMYNAVIEKDKQRGELAQRISMEMSSVYQKDKILSESLPALKVMMNEAELCETFVKLPFTKLPEAEEKIIRQNTQNLIEKYKLNWI